MKPKNSSFQGECDNLALHYCRFILLDENNALGILNSCEDAPCLVRVDLSKFERVESYPTHDGNIYQHDARSRKFSILRFLNEAWQLPEEFVKPVISFSSVVNGVFLVSSDTDVEFWNGDCSKCLKCFSKVSKVERCESVSNYAVACITGNEVNFIDVLSQTIVSTTPLATNEKVLACSRKT